MIHDPLNVTFFWKYFSGSHIHMSSKHNQVQHYTKKIYDMRDLCFSFSDLSPSLSHSFSFTFSLTLSLYCQSLTACLSLFVIQFSHIHCKFNSFFFHSLILLHCCVLFYHIFVFELNRVINWQLLNQYTLTYAGCKSFETYLILSHENIPLIKKKKNFTSTPQSNKVLPIR